MDCNSGHGCPILKVPALSSMSRIQKNWGQGIFKGNETMADNKDFKVVIKGDVDAARGLNIIICALLTKQGKRALNSVVSQIAEFDGNDLNQDDVLEMIEAGYEYVNNLTIELEIQDVEFPMVFERRIE